MSLKNNPVVVAAVLAVAALAAYWFLVLTPKQEEAAALKQQITAKRTELETARRDLATYQQAKAGYKANYATVARLGKAVPGTDDVRSLMVQVGAAAGTSKVSFDSINVSPADASGAAAGGPTGFAASPFGFAFAGTYFSLSDFVGRLQRFVSVSDSRIDVTGRLLVVNSLQLSPDGDGFPRISAQVSGSSYVITDGEDVTAGATATAPAGVAPSAATPAPATSSAPTTTATVTGVIR